MARRAIAGGDAGDRRDAGPAAADRRPGRERGVGQSRRARRAEIVRPDHVDRRSGGR